MRFLHKGANKTPTARLFAAVQSGDRAGIRAALDAGAAIHAHAGCHKGTVLHEAFRCPLAVNFAVVTDLLAAGASPLACDARGQSPLHCAARRGPAASVLALLRAGADARALDHHDLSPLHGGVIATYDRNPRDLALLEPQAALLIVKSLLAGGADPNNRDREDRRTPLHWLARSETPDSGPVMAYLLAQGGRLDIPDRQGFMVREVAQMYGHIACIDAIDAHSQKCALETIWGDDTLNVIITPETYDSRPQ